MSEYYEDEYDCWDDGDYYAEDEPEYRYMDYIVRNTKGRLYISSVMLIKHYGQDWGECDTQERHISLGGMPEWKRRQIVVMAKDLKCGEFQMFTGWDENELA